MKMIKGLKKVDKMPESGEFIGVWIYKGIACCAGLKIESGVLSEYQGDTDEYEERLDDAYEHLDISFFVIDESLDQSVDSGQYA